MRDAQGNKITTKEFFSRWKEGVQNITLLQQVKISLMGNFLVIIGVLIGLYTTFRTEVWWLFIILCGSFFLTSVGTLANYQKYLGLVKIQKMMEEAKNEPRT